jgi:hypothetical protein
MNKLVNVVLGIVLVVVLLCLITKHLDSIFFPFANDFREGHTYSSTFMLLNGENPYSINSYPVFINSYGILFNIVVYPFAYLFGNSVVLHRIVSSSFIFATLFLVFRQSFKNKDFYVFNLICFILLYSGLIYGPNSSVRPDGLGVFLFVCSIIIPVNSNFKKGSLVLSILFGLLSFYTKPYFLIGCIVILIYVFLFVNKWRAILFSFILLVSFLILGYVVFKLMPLYFYETLFAYTSSLKIIQLAYSVKQLKHFFFFSLPFLPFLASIIFCKSGINQLLSNSYSRLLIMLLAFLFFPLGLNSGAFLTYHFQIMMPVMCLFLLTLESKVVHSIKFNMWPLLLSVVLFFSFTYRYVSFSKSVESDFESWESLSEYVDTKNNILASPLLSSLLIDKSKKIYDNGVSAFVNSKHHSEIANRLFGLDAMLDIRKRTYISDLRYKIHYQKFDAIIVSPELPEVVGNYIEHDKYHLVKAYNLRTPHDGAKYRINIWEPIRK